MAIQRLALTVRSRQPEVQLREDVLYARTRVVVLKLGQVVDVAVNGDVQAIGLVMRRNVASREDLGHGWWVVVNGVLWVSNWPNPPENATQGDVTKKKERER
jgi:hypothetical protein